MKIFYILIFLTNSLCFANKKCLEIPEKQLQDWLKIKPAPPPISSLIQAKKLIDDERSYSLKLGSDKTAHCYLGCRISEKINYSTAHFVAWQKEYNDATDCDQKTHFEIEDFNATLFGAKVPSRFSQFTCEDTCIDEFPKIKEGTSQNK